MALDKTATTDTTAAAKPTVDHHHLTAELQQQQQAQRVAQPRPEVHPASQPRIQPIVTHPTAVATGDQSHYRNPRPTPQPGTITDTHTYPSRNTTNPNGQSSDHSGLRHVVAPVVVGAGTGAAVAYAMRHHNDGTTNYTTNQPNENIYNTTTNQNYRNENIYNNYRNENIYRQGGVAYPPSLAMNGGDYGYRNYNYGNYGNYGYDSSYGNYGNNYGYNNYGYDNYGYGNGGYYRDPGIGLAGSFGLGRIGNLIGGVLSGAINGGNNERYYPTPVDSGTTYGAQPVYGDAGNYAPPPPRQQYGDGAPYAPPPPGRPIQAPIEGQKPCPPDQVHRPGDGHKPGDGHHRGEHVVREGENLWKIAEHSLNHKGQQNCDEKQILHQVNRIVAANKEHYPSLETNPNVIQPGMILKIPHEHHRQPQHRQELSYTQPAPEASAMRAKV